MDDLCVAFSCKRTASWRQARALRAARGDDLRAGAGAGAGSAADGELLRRERFLGDGHCSALVKPLGPLSAPTDVTMGHTTWNPYETMTRIYKTYDFPWSISGGSGSSVVPGRQISFSSFPACFYSFASAH